ncbi:UDP-glycosyltransferase 87A2 [Arachis ipaensis]|nr:UDP-glycosyltransferase 87A2 [Arachis ipaensis]
MQWLDSQPKGSVLYISLGSYLSISKEQMEELVVGLCDSGVRFLMVYRGPNKTLLSQNSNSGLFVPWCDQLRVLSHKSIGGFLSHCGWNSVLEAMFCGVPVLTFPISIDQVPNSKQIVEDLKVGVKMKERLGTNNKENDVVMRKEIARIVKGFMDFESRGGRELRETANKVREVCRNTIVEGGSSLQNLNAFLEDILQSN